MTAPVKRPKVRTTTHEEFIEFQGECNRIRQSCGLGDWELYFEHNRFATYPHGGAAAMVNWNESATIATLQFNTHPMSNDLDPVCTAKHEMAHVITGKLMLLAESRYTSEDELNREFEKVAIILSRVL